MTNTCKLLLILRIRLYAKASREDELPDRSAEAGEEGVEWLFVNTTRQYNVKKIQTNTKFKS